MMMASKITDCIVTTRIEDGDNESGNTMHGDGHFWEE